MSVQWTNFILYIVLYLESNAYGENIFIWSSTETVQMNKLVTNSESVVT